MKKIAYSPLTILLVLLILSGVGLSGSALTPAEAAVSAGPTELTETLVFDGSGDYISIADDPALRLSGGSLTIEAWIKPDDVDGCQTFVSKGFAASSYWFGHCGGVLRFYGNGSAVDANTVLPVGFWTHVAVTKSGAGLVQFYINGELDDTVTGAVTPSNSNTKPVTIGADPDLHTLLGTSTRYEFDGKIANVRLWSTTRTANDIRRSMHVMADDARTGVVANWWLSGDYRDRINGFDGTRTGNLFFDDTEAPPAQPDYPLVNLDFDSGFGLTRSGSPHAYLPATDEWLIIGGQNGFSSVDRSIRRFDPNTGRTRFLDNLPQSLHDAPAAYASVTDRVYTFGGRTNTTFSTQIDTIYKINPADGSSSALAATLPTAITDIAAVYHPPSEKILLFGGFASGTGTLNAVHLFDPVAETVTTLPQTLPTATYDMAVAYSPATESVFLFGGYNNPTDLDTILEIELNEAQSDVVITTSSANLPVGNYGMRAVVDPVSQLIYLLGGRNQEILAFDPVTNQIWTTRIQLPERRYFAIVMYSVRQRAAYLLGGVRSFGTPERDLWRFALGDGPAVPVGRWDFPAPVGAEITALDGEVDTMLVGTTTDRAWRYTSDGVRYHYTVAQVGSSKINDVDYDSATGKRIFATNSSGVKIDSSGVIQTISGGPLGSATALAVEYAAQTGEPLIGTDTQGLRRLRYNSFSGIYIWDEDFDNQNVWDIARTADNQVYVIINEGGNERLGRLTYSSTFGFTTEYPNSVCGLDNPLELTIGGDGSYWIAGNRATEFDVDAGICYIAPTTSPGAGTRFTPAIGDEAVGIDTDLDGRVWVALDHGFDQTGGAIVYESASSVTTTEYNHLNAPISGRDRIPVGLNYPWDSAVSAVSAVDERVWLGQPDGDLITYAPRWTQWDESNSMDGRTLQNVWTVRGRLFAASSTSLHVLMPDSQTWENLSSGKVWDVMGDSRGNIWVATQTGVRLYTPSGWDYLTDRAGDRPSTAVYTLAEDQDGRVWIGGLHGLTLFDRDRFVATFDDTNSDLPDERIRTLFVDSDNNLWIGTDVGLTKFDGIDWTTFTTADGLPNNAIFDIEQTDTGELAVSTASGLSFYDDVTFTTQILPIPGSNLPLSVDDKGRLWAGAAVQVGETEWQPYTTINSGLASDEVSDHAADGAERIWFSHAPDAGISVRSSYLPPLSDSLPVITSVEPAFGKAGDRITINGSGFGNSYRDMDVFFGSGTAEIDRIYADRVEVILNEDATTGDVVVKVGERQGARSNAFCAVPVVNEFTPTGGNVGVTVRILGTNFDPNAQVTIGGASIPAVFYRGATQLGFDITDGIPNGVVTVQNQCAGSTYQSTSTGREFRRIDLQLDEVNLNQGISSMPLVADRPTMVSHFLRTTNNGSNFVPRPTDQIDINQIQMTFSEPGGATWSTNIDYNGPVPTFFLPINDIIRADITNFVNVSVTPNLDGDTGSAVTVSTTLRNRGRVVASGSTSLSFMRNRKLRVLMVPIMRNNFSSNDLRAMQANVNDELEDIRRRIMPMGDVELYWSNSAVEVGDLFDGPSQLDPGDYFRLYDAGHSMDRFRRHWNHLNPDRKVSIAFGVIDGMILDPNAGASGLAFWPDVSAMINAAGLTVLDTLCDIGDAFIGILTLGLAGGGGCNLEIPLYVAWGSSTTGNSSHLIGHEVGHVLGLVRAVAPNGNLTDNFTHSVNDEIDGGECATLQTMGNSASYNVTKTLYRQPGVQGPIVNPLTNGQWLPRLATTTTMTFTQPTTFTVTSEAFTGRAKAIMSYACGRGNRQVYFEPADVGFLNAGYLLAPNTPGDARPDGPITMGVNAAPRPVAGDRIYVSGVVSRTLDAGQLVNVEMLGASGPIDMSYETGTWLVQKDAAGVELARTGIFPVFENSEQAHHLEEGHVEPVDTGFFATTVIAESGLARIDLVKGTAVLDTFAAGSAAPTVAINSPTGGSFATGDITVSWNANDPDGDPLSIGVYFSDDNGANWVPIAFPDSEESSIAIPVTTLVGSENGRFKVVVSDGFQQAEATSAAVKIAAQPPLPFIGAPADGAIFLEGQQVRLTGGAYTNLGDLLPGSALSWASNRDGLLGSGEVVDVELSVGTHLIELIATAPDGGKGSATISLTILGDYDFDGLADGEELDEGLNLFNQHDTRSDEDGDGVPWLQEHNWGTNPGVPDSDGDGRSDGDEIAAGTDPAASDAPLPADALSVSVDELTYAADLAVATPDPQTVVSVLSREPVDWQVSADQSWIEFSKIAGTTTDAVTVVAKASRLPNGIHSAEITFNSTIGTVTVPVTVTVNNSLVPVGFDVFLPMVVR
ncbi:MAG: two-component regulator propeller domain-containing protein [Ardenticatenaceae bacterium]|nr:two-component regulator propeller domain-containing protein [Ardenticatenaceae bacterium]